MNENTGVPQPAAATAPRLPQRRRRFLEIAILVSSAVIVTSVVTLALKDWLTPKPPLGQKAAEMIAQDMRHRFELSEDQTRRVQEVMGRRLDAIETLRQDAQQKMTAEHEKLRADVKAILTPEQFERWSAHFDAIRPPGFGPPHGPPGGPPDHGRPMPGGPPGQERPMPGGPPDRDRPPPGGPPGPDRPMPSDGSSPPPGPGGPPPDAGKEGGLPRK